MQGDVNQGGRGRSAAEQRGWTRRALFTAGPGAEPAEPPWDGFAGAANFRTPALYCAGVPKGMRSGISAITYAITAIAATDLATSCGSSLSGVSAAVW